MIQNVFVFVRFQGKFKTSWSDHMKRKKMLLKYLKLIFLIKSIRSNIKYKNKLVSLE